MFCKHPDNYVQRTAMHLLRCFRCTCLHLIDQAQCNDEQLMAFVDWVNPKTSNAFGALYAVYQIGNAVCVDSWPSFGVQAPVLVTICLQPRHWLRGMGR